MIELNNYYGNALRNYRFIDLFCGIGGFHLALSSFGATCVFASDIDSEARHVYKKNFNIEPQGRIEPIVENATILIPKHDILCGGFPCQAFSISGNQEGFSDKKTGKLFFEIIKIISVHKPKVILLENVANLEKHDGGRTIGTITESFKNLGYIPHFRVLCASDYNVPQCRKRIYIVAFREDVWKGTFDFPNIIMRQKVLYDILDTDAEAIQACKINREYSIRQDCEAIEVNCKKPYIRIGEIGKGRQGERIYSSKGCATTLSASSGGLGGRTGIYYTDGKIRKLTPRECARLMGFPDSFKIAEKQNQAYRQFGNSVVVDVLQLILMNIVNILEGGQHG